MPRQLIATEGLSKHYRLGGRTVTALDEVSLLVEEGDYVAVTGPSGSGKTTLMKILGCLERPSRGRYRLGGIDVGGLSGDRMAEVRNRIIGFLFQSFLLLPQSTGSNGSRSHGPLLTAPSCCLRMSRRAPSTAVRPAMS